MAEHEKVYGVCENKCFVEVSPKEKTVDVERDQVISGEKTFEKINTKDFVVGDNENGSRVAFKAQSGKSFELTLPARSGTVALKEDIPAQPKYYLHNVVVEVKGSSQVLERDFGFQIMNKSSDAFTFASLIDYFKNMSAIGEFIGTYNRYTIISDNTILNAIGNRFKSKWESGTWKGLLSFECGLYNSSINAYTVPAWQFAWDDSTRGTSKFWSIKDEVVEI